MGEERCSTCGLSLAECGERVGLGLDAFERLKTEGSLRTRDRKAFEQAFEAGYLAAHGVWKARLDAMTAERDAADRLYDEAKTQLIRTQDVLVKEHAAKVDAERQLAEMQRDVQRAERQMQRGFVQGLASDPGGVIMTVLLPDVGWPKNVMVLPLLPVAIVKERG